jgi:hypothetical protein
VKIVVPFYVKDNVQGACNKLVERAVNSWKKEDDVVDDITCVVVFIKV